MYLTAASEKIGSKLRCKAADCPEGCGTVSTEWKNWLSCPLAVLFFLSELSAHRISEVAKQSKQQLREKQPENERSDFGRFLTP